MRESSLQKGGEKGSGFVELSLLAGLGGVAGEEDEIDGAFFVEQSFQIALPGVAQNTAAAPRFLLARTFQMEIGEVQEFEGVLPEGHGSTEV